MNKMVHRQPVSFILGVYKHITIAREEDHVIETLSKKPQG